MLECRLQFVLRLIDINITRCWKIFRRPPSGVSTDVDKHDRVSKSRKQTQQPEETRFAGRFERFLRMVTLLGSGAYWEVLSMVRKRLSENRFQTAFGGVEKGV